MCFPKLFAQSFSNGDLILKISNLFYLVPLFSAFAFFGAAHAQTAPSFDCAKAKSFSERLVCVTPELAKKDALLNELYKTASISAFGTGVSNIKSSQIDWIKGQKTCEKAKEAKDCLNRAYDSRIYDLAIYTLFVNPEKSFPIIDKELPAAAPFYHAVYEYVTMPQTPSRDKRIANYFRPAYSKMASTNDYVKSVADDAGVKSPEDGLKSDKNFGVLYALSAYGLEQPISMPCAAMLKKPGISNATEAYFGSSIDGFLPSSDCSVVLPQLPKFVAIEAFAYKKAPDCGGTIIHGIVHSNIRENSLIRMGQLDEILGGENQGYNDDDFSKQNPKAFNDALDELVAYYAKYLPAKKYSRTDIRNALNIHLNKVSEGC